MSVDNRNRTVSNSRVPSGREGAPSPRRESGGEGAHSSSRDESDESLANPTTYEVPLPPGSFFEDAPESQGASHCTQSPLWDFFRFAHNDLSADCIILSFSPLPAELVTELHPRVLAPAAGSGTLDVDGAAHNILSRCQAIIGACMVGDAHAVEAIGNILSQLQDYSHAKVFVAMLLPSGSTFDDMHDVVESEHDKLTRMGVHEVLLNPPLLAGRLQYLVRLGQIIQSQQMGRLEQRLDSEEVESFYARELQALEKKETKLLWCDIPHELRNVMPLFPPLMRNISEDTRGPLGMSVDQYTFVHRYQCDAGNVFLARDSQDVPVVVKVTVKSEVHSPQEIEAFNREITFLTNSTHPNVAKVYAACLHTVRHLYIILEFSGDENLEQYCQAQPGELLDEREAIAAFKQVAEALAWLHRKRISHRQVSLHHVVVKQQASIHCTLVDLHQAIIAHGDMVSTTVCGCLPCMAPEVGLAESYIPRFVDAWSAGILLLEISGGLGSLSRSTYFDLDLDNDSGECLEAVFDFFESPNCHQKALGVMNGVSSHQVLLYLHELLVVAPQNRKSMTTLVGEWHS